MQPTLKDLRREIKNYHEILEQRDLGLVQAQRTIEGLEKQIATQKNDADQAQEAIRLRDDRIQILLGDRDRLTATIEVCTRRLVSPQVETSGDRRRSGWRAGTPERLDLENLKREMSSPRG